MGLNANICLIKSDIQVAPEALLKALGYKIVSQRKSTLEKQIYTQKNFSIGFFEGTTILAHAELVLMGVADEALSREENIFQKLYKPAVMLSVGLQHAMNVYGYSLIQNGKKIRVNTGSIEGKIFEFGSITPKESEIKSRYGYDVRKNMYFTHDRTQFGHEDMIGEEMAMNLTTMLLSKPLDQLDLSDIKMISYKIEPLPKASFWSKMALISRLASFIKSRNFHLL